MQRTIAQRLLRLSIWLAPLGLLLVAHGAFAQESLRDGFESPEAIWRDGGGEARYRIEAIERVQQGAHGGNGCEHVEISAGGNGRSVFLVYPIGRAPVIAELRPSLWLRSDRPGAQIFLRVVLPRALDARTNQPMTLLLPGSGYATVGNWQALQVMDPAAILKQQTWNLRVQNKMVIDSREAYVDQVLLNVYNEGKTNVWIDDLEVRGAVAASTEQPTLTPATPVGLSGRGVEEFSRQTTVELSNGSLLIDGRPFFPRFVEYRGEPLRHLRGLGFNGVVFEQIPAPELLAEAKQLGLWLVTPPPADGGRDALGRDAAIGPEFDAVAAWNLRAGLTDAELEPTRRLAESVRRRDRRMIRPLVASPITQLMPFSRTIDVLLFARDPIGTSFEQADYRDWIEQRSRLARPGTPCWVTVQTELSPELVEQMALLSRRSPPPQPRVSIEQVRACAYSAIAAGARGLVFRSSNRLDGNDPTTQYRSALCELINLEMQLLEPWTAGGSQVTEVAAIRYEPVNTIGQPRTLRPNGDIKKLLNPALAVNPDIMGLMLQTERARLLLPVWQGEGAQFAAGQSAANNVSFVLPGAPESTEAYELTPGGLRPPFKRQRVTGGVRITFDEAGMSSMVVLTQDALVARALSQRLAEMGRRSTELERWLAAESLATATEIDTLLTAAGQPIPEAIPYFSVARMNMQQSDQRVAANDTSGAVLAARRAERPIRLIERAHWQHATRLLASPVSSPLATNFSTLGDHQMFMATLATMRWQPNKLPEGDFEDIGRMVQAGWQRLQFPIDGVRADVELSTTYRRNGRSSLRLSATPAPERGNTLLDAPPVWMQSPTVMVEAGSWIRISGWAYVPGAIGGTYEGLMIFDSQTGQALAERIGQSSRWKPFVLLRAARSSGPLNVTIALTGTGEAWVDDLAIETMPGPGRPAMMNVVPGPIGPAVGGGMPAESVPPGTYGPARVNAGPRR